MMETTNNGDNNDDDDRDDYDDEDNLPKKRTIEKDDPSCFAFVVAAAS